MERLLKIAEVSEILQVSPKTIYPDAETLYPETGIESVSVGISRSFIIGCIMDIYHILKFFMPAGAAGSFVFVNPI